MAGPYPTPLPALVAGSIAACMLSCGPPADPDLAFHRGANALDERRFELARTYFAEDLERHPERSESWRLGGRSWMSGSYQSATRAVEHWQHYLDLQPDDVEVAIQLTRALLLLGEWRQAQSWSTRLDDSARSQVLRAQVWLETDPAKATEAIAAARESAHDDPRFHAVAVEVYRRTGDQQQALAHARRAVELAPADPRGTYLLARLEQQLGNAEGAANLLATHQLLTRLTGAAGTPEPSPVEALRLLRQLEARLGAGDLGLRLKKLRLLVAGGERDQARAMLATFATVTPADLPPATRLELAGLAEKTGELDVARGLLEGVLRRQPPADGGVSFAGDPDRDAREREALYGLALLARRRGDTSSARELLEESLERFPHTARSHHLLGRLELEAGRNEAAAERFERALELAPWNADCRIDLANLMLSEGRLGDADVLLSAAPGEDPAIDNYRRRHGLL